MSISRFIIPSKFIGLCAALALPAAILAGSIDNRSNFSAEYLRHLARNSDSRSTDAAAYNPAGLAWIGDGLHLNFGNQTLYKHNVNKKEGSFDFNSDVLSPALPTAHLVYHKSNWAAFLAIEMEGGGGNVHYKKGTVTVLPLVGKLYVSDPATVPDAQLSSVYYGATLGGSYAINNWASLSIGARYVYARNAVQVKALGTTYIDHEETAQYPTFVLGAAFKPTDRLDIGLRYENITKLDWDVQKSDLNFSILGPVVGPGYEATVRKTLRPEGATFAKDLPAVIGAGVGYTFLPNFRTDIAFTTYLNTLADWGELDDEVDNGFEYAIGFEYLPMPVLTLSTGYMYTFNGANSDTYFPESPALDGPTYAGGGRYQFTPRFSLDLAATFTDTWDDHVNVPQVGAVDLEKWVMVYAFGITYRLF